MTISFIKDFFIVLGGFVSLLGVLYWIIRAKLKEDFCTKMDCYKKHESLDSVFMSYRKDISDELKEIKDMVKEIRGWVFEWTNKGVKQ